MKEGKEGDREGGREREGRREGDACYVLQMFPSLTRGLLRDLIAATTHFVKRKL